MWQHLTRLGRSCQLRWLFPPVCSPIKRFHGCALAMEPLIWNEEEEEEEGSAQMRHLRGRRPGDHFGYIEENNVHTKQKTCVMKERCTIYRFPLRFCRDFPAPREKTENYRAASVVTTGAIWEEGPRGTRLGNGGIVLFALSWRNYLQHQRVLHSPFVRSFVANDFKSSMFLKTAQIFVFKAPIKKLSTTTVILSASSGAQGATGSRSAGTPQV